MIIYRSSATIREIATQVRSRFLTTVVDDRPQPVDKQVMAAVGYAAQVRIKAACQPIFDNLNQLDNLFGALSYEGTDTRRTVVRTNMGLLFANTNTGDK